MTHTTNVNIETSIARFFIDPIMDLMSIEYVSYKPLDDTVSIEEFDVTITFFNSVDRVKHKFKHAFDANKIRGMSPNKSLTYCVDDIHTSLGLSKLSKGTPIFTYFTEEKALVRWCVIKPKHKVHRDTLTNYENYNKSSRPTKDAMLLVAWYGSNKNDHVVARSNGQ